MEPTHDSVKADIPKSTSPIRTSEIMAGIELMRIVYGLIKSTPGGLPSGELYALLLSTNKMNLHQYSQMIQLFIVQGLVKEENHRLFALPEAA